MAEKTANKVFDVQTGLANTFTIASKTYEAVFDGQSGLAKAFDIARKAS